MTGNPEDISSSVELVPTNRPSRYFWTEFHFVRIQMFAAMLDIGIRTAATMRSEINVMFWPGLLCLRPQRPLQPVFGQHVLVVGRYLNL